jgi:SPP1 gp7 family putative phage head morphogenesis protein
MTPLDHDRIADALADCLLAQCSCGHSHARARIPRANYFAVYEKALAPWIARFRSMLTRIWDEERRIILANLKKLKGWRGKGPDSLIDSILYPKRRFVDMLDEEARTFFLALMLDEGTRRLEELDLDVAFDIADPNVRQWVDNYTPKFSEELEQVNTDTLRSTLNEGLEAGEGIPQLAARVNDTFETFNKYRAEVIARTETIRASNQAALESYRQSGVVEKKAWLASPESCEICQELEAGEPIALDATFFEDGYSDGQGPPRHPNCSCAVTAHIED